MRRLVVVASLLLAGCAWFNGGGGVKIANAVICIESDALKGDNVQQIAQDCGVDVAQVLVSLAETKDPRVPNTPAAREARVARLAMMAVDGGW